MSNREQIRIRRAIMHNVDQYYYDQPILSDSELSMTEAVADLVRNYISWIRQHKYTRTARFVEGTGGETSFREICDRLLSDPSAFVPWSQVIARRLFEIMAGDRRTSPGDLLVCVYSVNGEEHPRLGVLKLEAEQGFLVRRETVDGRPRFVLGPVANVLPGWGDLQKAAFVLPAQLRKAAGYDLKVLDQQVTRYGGRRAVASFFIQDFLQCRVDLGSEERTRAFVNASQEWLSRIREAWSQGDVERFLGQLRGALEGELVDVEAFSQAAIPCPDGQEEYVSFLVARGLDQLTFAPDPAQRTQSGQYTWFEGDDGLRVRIRSDAVGPGKTLRIAYNEPTHTWRVTIETVDWRERTVGGGQ